MLSETVRSFVNQNRNAVLTTFRKSGAAQMSVVTVGPYQDGVGFTTTSDRAKLWNLKRDPRCSLLVSQSNWWGYVVLEGKATVLSPGEADPEELKMALRDIYRAASKQEHPDWDEYDQAMVDDKRSAVIVVPDLVYGTRT